MLEEEAVHQKSKWNRKAGEETRKERETGGGGGEESGVKGRGKRRGEGEEGRKASWFIDRPSEGLGVEKSRNLEDT